MTNLRRYVAFVVLFSLCSASLALEVNGSGYFEKLMQGSDKGVPITRATLADKVSYKFSLIVLPGEYPLLIAIYDGKGREAFRAQATLTVTTGHAGRSISYDFDKLRDAPGTWWYVVTLNDQVVLSTSIEVEP
jgi:hypothetical protein